MNAINAQDDEVKQIVIEFYRDEIRRRYQLVRMRRLKEFEGIPDALLDALREFFLERMYPPQSMREKMDAAFLEMGRLMRSPKRFTPLLRSALTSMLWLGWHAPAAVSAAITTVDALHKTRKLEACMMDVAHALHLTPKDAANRATMLRVMAGVPQQVVKKLINDVIGLFEALSNVKMLSAMLHIMERCQDTMEARPDVYDDHERECMALALEVLRGGHDLFLQLKPQDFPRIIKGIEITELTWYASVLQEAGEAT